MPEPRLFGAVGALPWESVAGEAWTVDRGHGRIDVRTIKALPPTPTVKELFPHVEQVFLVERYSDGTDGELPGAVAVPGITSLPASQAGAAGLLACLRGHWAIEVSHLPRCRARGGRQPDRPRSPGHGRRPQRERRPQLPRKYPMTSMNTIHRQSWGCAAPINHRSCRRPDQMVLSQRGSTIGLCSR